MVDGRTRGFTQSSIPDAYDRFMLGQLFEPWATDLLSRAELRAGQSVLDVASGLGPVARLSATMVGPEGHVVASDISAAMLAAAAAKQTAPTSRAIEYLECSATALKVDSDSFDVVVCQQGLQFFPDRAAAVREMRRAARPEGLILISTWAAEHPLGLFGPIAEILGEAGVDEPYPGAYDPESYTISSSDLAELLDQAGLRDVSVETVRLDAVWESIDDATSTLLGTPFGPLVCALPPDQQNHLRSALADRLGRSEDGTVVVRTMSHTARGRK